jgi:hypothetical protein
VVYSPSNPGFISPPFAFNPLLTGDGTLGSGGGITGQKITNSFGQILQKALSGNMTVTPTGFQQFTVNASFTDANGNPQTATETYLALATQNDIRIIQTGGGAPGLLTLSK